MAVEVRFVCDGCHIEERGITSLRKEFVSVSGRPYGIGSYRYKNTPADVAPKGWVPYDPYTQCCYCSDCWKEIGGEDE